MNIYLLVGLPGSGKSFFLKDKEGYIFDDFSNIPQAMILLENALKKEDKDIYLADVNLSELSTFKKAVNKIKEINKSFIINIVYFESNKEICINNVIYRNDKRNVGPTIERFHKSINSIKEYLKENNEFYKVQTIITPKQLNNKLNF